jgi:hypothetical protein
MSGAYVRSITIAIAFALLSDVACAEPLTTTSTGKDWWKASRSERVGWLVTLSERLYSSEPPSIAKKKSLDIGTCLTAAVTPESRAEQSRIGVMHSMGLPQLSSMCSVLLEKR